LKEEDEKWDRQNKGYNPWGRQGGGAPMRDETGHIIASRVGYFSIDTNNQGNLPYNFQADVKIHEYENSRQKSSKVD